ncbi:hypothetical protein [Xanthobacter agilis]|uniref:hypothetical protein n=1 Tax=Xanthobacter agilis TaxID=47492 RepID=UPI00372B9444
MDHANDNPVGPAPPVPDAFALAGEGHAEPTAIHAVPAQLGASGFRLLLLREFRGEGPPGFALIDQHLLRAPHRLHRHGVSFALTFRPEVMAGLAEAIGRLSMREGVGPAVRNPRWPAFGWWRTPRTWADGTDTVEWFADVHFADAAAWVLFRTQFAEGLAGRPPAPRLAGELP